MKKMQRRGTLLLQTVGLLSMLLIALGGWTIGQVNQQRVRVSEREYWQNKLKALRLLKTNPPLTNDSNKYPQISELKSSIILVEFDRDTAVTLKKPL